MVKGDLIVRKGWGDARYGHCRGNSLRVDRCLGPAGGRAAPVGVQSRLSYQVRKAQICLLTSIPTQASPITDATRLAELRTRLPDTFACGRCRYDLAGDATAAYY